MRLSPDGQLDLSFAAGRLTFGTPENEVLDSVAAMPDRGVLVDAGTCGQLGCGSGIQRYGASGVLDTTFANKGNLGPKAMSGYASVYGAGLVTATSFMAWGTDQGSASPAVAVWMFSLAGQPDDQFGTAGLYEPTPADSRERGIVDAAAMPDGRRLFVGYDATSNSSFDYHLSMLMLLPNGSPDPTVGAGGVMRDAAVVFLPAHVAVRADHRVAVLGTLNPVTMGQVVVRTYFW
jgi:hypothetical protein